MQTPLGTRREALVTQVPAGPPTDGWGLLGLQYAAGGPPGTPEHPSPAPAANPHHPISSPLEK